MKMHTYSLNQSENILLVETKKPSSFFFFLTKIISISMNESNSRFLKNENYSTYIRHFSSSSIWCHRQRVMTFKIFTIWVRFPCSSELMVPEYTQFLGCMCPGVEIIFQPLCYENGHLLVHYNAQALNPEADLIRFSLFSHYYCLFYAQENKEKGI